MDNIIEIDKQIEILHKRRRQIAGIVQNNNGRLSDKYAYNLLVSRKLRGMSQTELANLVGASRTTINNIEKGVTVPTLDMFLKLNNILKYYLIEPMLTDETNRPKYKD